MIIFSPSKVIRDSFAKLIIFMRRHPVYISKWQKRQMTTVNSRAGAEKRRVEGSLHTMQAEIDDMLHQAKNSEEKAKKAMVDAASSKT